MRFRQARHIRGRGVSFPTSILKCVQFMIRRNITGPFVHMSQSNISRNGYRISILRREVLTSRKIFAYVDHADFPPRIQQGENDDPSQKIPGRCRR